MRIERFLAGYMGTNCYLVTDEASGKAAIVDPGGVVETIDEKLKAGAGRVEWILLTHGHFDHIGAAVYYRQLTGAKIVISENEKEFLWNAKLNLGSGFHLPVKPFDADVTLQDGAELKLGALTIKMLLTPGHTSGGCCYVIDDSVFTGDTLMRRTIGRTDFPTGDMAKMKESLEMLKELDGNYRIYPGHGDATTLQQEREQNPYMGQADYDDLY